MIRLRSIRSFIVAVALGCVPPSTSGMPPQPACADGAARRWEIPAAGERVLRVWLDTEAQDLDGWRSYGMRRLRFAMDEWNSLRLPVRFTPARSARDSDIVVDIIAAVPPADDSTGRDQAALTRLTWLPSGAIVRARVLIAVTTPGGRRVPLLDQQANLLHELGHALGLPHITETSAVMATRRTSYQLTGADIGIARAHYRCRTAGGT